MTDVLVTLPISRGGLKHLEEKILATLDYSMIVFWEFNRIPKKLNAGDKLFVVCEGYVRGSFYVSGLEEHRVILNSWKKLEPIQKMKGFQGYRYTKLVLEEEDPMVKLCDKISFIIFENVEKAFSEHMKEKDIKPTVGEPEGFGSYCAAKIIERISRIFTEDYIIKKKEES